MKGGQTPDPAAPAGNVEPEELATNREGETVPWFCGEQTFALKWIMDPKNQFTREAPAERPGKK